MASLANVTLEVPVGAPTHPDQNMQRGESGVVLPQADGHESGLNSQDLATYLYWAKVQRREEMDAAAAGAHHHAATKAVEAGAVADMGSSDGGDATDKEKEAGGGGVGLATTHAYGNTTAATTTQLDGVAQLEAEKLMARRALRTATWVTAFYLLTTDILGPFNAPYALSSLGSASGSIIYVVMGIAAYWGGMLLWGMFCQLDSMRYPIRTYSDIGERILGFPMRLIAIFLQSVQLIINVGLICLSNGQALTQVIDGSPSGGHLCFSICVLLFALLGMGVGQIRTLRNLGLVANIAVWLNISVCIITIAAVAHYGANVKAAQQSYGTDYPYDNQPVMTAAFVSSELYAKINAVFNCVFAYGGAMIFPEIMAEMRRPLDFWKGMIAAQALICGVYLVFGNVVYHYQGQYSLAQAYNGIPTYALQTVCNMMAIVSGTIAAVLYGNIGVKVIYIQLVEGILKGPALLSRKGAVVWFGMILVYWALAFIIGSAIPSVGTITGLVGAACIVQFSYTFPFLYAFVFEVQKDAAAEDRPFVEADAASPAAVADRRADSWREASRWRRGLLGGEAKVYLGVLRVPAVLVKLVYLVLSLACMAMAGLGLYGTGIAVREALKNGAATSFGCTPPV